MTRVPGSSQFLNAATLANTRGLAAGSPSLLGDSNISLLDSGRRISRNNGIGLSASSRAANRQLIESTRSESNALFSLAIGQGNSVQGAQTQILALRSQTPDSQLARSLQVDDGSFSAPTTGQEIDTEA